jgi:hypothetical protein
LLGAKDVGDEEGLSASDRPVDVAFCCQVNNGVGALAQLVNERCIVDRSVDKANSGVIQNASQVLHTPRVGQGVKQDNLLKTQSFCLSEHDLGEPRSNETGNTGDEDTHGSPSGELEGQ